MNSRALSLVLIIFSGVFETRLTLADSLPQLYRSIRAQAMGDAISAIVEDEQAVFYNPAGLAGIKDFGFHLLSINAEVSKDLLADPAVFTKVASSGFNVTDLNSFIGKNEFVRVQATSSIFFPGFTVMGIGDVQAAVRLNNPSNPGGTIGGVATYGVQAGYGGTILSFAKKRGEIRVGIAGKYLNRSGSLKGPTITDILTLNYSGIIGKYTSFAAAYGWDVGAQAVYRIKKNITLMAGITTTDIGNTTFSNASPEIPSNLVIGAAARIKTQDISLTLSYDHKHVFENIDWRKKIHAGLEVKLPILSIYGGLNQLWLTYGGSIDIGMVKVMYANYTEELSSVVGINPENRHILNFEFQFDL